MTPLEKVLGQLHTELAEKLLEKLQSGEVSTSELNVIRQFLKDNGVDSPYALKEGSPIRSISDHLPFRADDEPIGREAK